MTDQTLIRTLLIFLCTTAAVEAGERIRLWSAELSKLIGETTADPQPVWGLAFSPDGTRLAIGFGQQWTADPRISRGRVIIVAVDGTHQVLHQFAVNDTPAFAVPGNVEWSPSGNSLAIRGLSLFTLDGNQTCSVQDGHMIGGFLRGDRLVTYQRWQGGSSNANEIRVYRSDCFIEDSWHRADQWTGVWGSCPQANLLGLRTGFSQQQTEITLISYPSRNKIQQWTWNGNALLAGITFADSCRMVCSGQLHQTSKEAYAACWDIRTGEKVVENPELTVTDLPAFNGAGGAVLATTVYKWACLENKLWVFLDMNGCTTRLKRRLIWGARTDREISSWSVEEQAIQMPGKAHKRKLAPFALALSPTGEYMAEAGSGRLQLYAIHDSPKTGAP